MQGVDMGGFIGGQFGDFYGYQCRIRMDVVVDVNDRFWMILILNFCRNKKQLFIIVYINMNYED